MIEWLMAETAAPNGVLILFLVFCGVAMVFASWALDVSSKRLQQATAFYQWYLVEQATPQPNVDEGDGK
jgi:uncharacterized membrane protein